MQAVREVYCISGSDIGMIKQDQNTAVRYHNSGLHKIIPCTDPQLASLPLNRHIKYIFHMLHSSASPPYK